MPDDLIKAVQNSEAVIFAGAGISTENKLTFPCTLYEEILGELEISAEESISFPEAMEKLEQKNGRLDLIKAIIHRLEYIKSFPELYRRATEFHRELSTIPQINEIITTNWDDYFEKECGARPFVNEDDAVFLDLPCRKVLKIHGSINNVSSIIATTKDYKKAKRNLTTGILGSKLKLLLANKTIIFIGYSFRDDDFKQIYQLVGNLTGKLSKRRYMITISKKDEAFLKKYNLIPIYTNGTFFLHRIREAISEKCRLLPVEALGAIATYLRLARIEHERISKRIERSFDAELFYCQSYQDGLIHAFEYHLNRTEDGFVYNLPAISGNLFFYDNLLNKKKKKNNWWDVAYIKGYMRGIKAIAMLGEEILLPVDYYYNIFNDTYSETLTSFTKSYKIQRKNVRSIEVEMKRILEKNGNPSKSIIFHHTPFLF